ncbi:uncharacterized protein LOC117177088 [Belonocnema kinseyi]|uniref:uncharacterized protein LOC117177088 n=1 Tax=Belonocnema kinseyi TaxID=2817044 RepID=UPI00143D75A5|nr:uncharacterized protein LOC117177088 [Belonocnema kinseyi]
MGASNENTKAWLEDELIPKLKSCLKRTDSSMSYKVSTPQDSFFLSRVFFLDLKFAENEKREFNSEYNLVVKQPTALKTLNELLKVEVPFTKEILFYRKFAQNSSDYPRCFYTLDKAPYDSLVILENLTKDGYQICSKKANLQMEFVLAAVQEIARFHAKSYILKNKQPKEFFNFIEEINKLNSRILASKDSCIMIGANAIGARIVNYLRRENYDKEFCDKIEPILVNACDQIVNNIKRSEEPLTVLCHGDFLRNNIVFKKIDDQIKAKVIDFGAIEYNSPGTDLSKFLILNCTREVRTSKLNFVIDAYHKALCDCLEEADVSNLERFSKPKFLEEYKTTALCVFACNSFFIPRTFDFVSDSVETLINLTGEESYRFYYEVGGDEMTKIFVGILQDLRESGCLDFFLIKNIGKEESGKVAQQESAK